MVEHYRLKLFGISLGIALILFCWGWSSATTLQDLKQEGELGPKEILKMDPKDLPAEPKFEFYQGDIPPQQVVLLQALDLLNTGKYKESIKIVENFLASNPNSAPGHEIFGAALALDGKIDEGLKELEKAVQINPRQGSALTKIGDIFIARGQWDEAEAKFNQAIQIAPGDERAHQRLGIIYDRKGETKKAIEHYEKGLVGTRPEYVGIKVDLARLYLQTREFQKSVDLLKNVTPPASKNTAAHITLGAALLGLGKKDEALQEFKIARDLEPQNEKSRFSLGIGYREKGDLTQSLEELKQVVKIKPKWADGHFQLGETQFKMGDYEKAVQSYAKAQELGMDSAFARKRTADAYLAQKRFSDAIAIYRDLLKSKGPSPQMYDLLGSAYQVSGQMNLAEQTFQEMEKKFPQNAFSSYRLGLFYGFVKKYDQAISQLQKSLTLIPGDPDILKALSLAYSGKGDRPKALEYAEKVAKARPENLEDQFYLAAVYQDAGRNKDATRVYREILSKKPDHAFALNNLAGILSEGGQLDEAQKLAQKAASLTPENGMILDTYGWILFKKKNNREALKALEKSASLMPNHPAILYHLGAVHHAQGNKAEAKKNLEKALTLSQDFKEASEARKLLNK